MVTDSVCLDEPSAWSAFRQMPSSARRIHVAVRNPHVAAAIHVHAVAIGVDLQIVQRKVVDPRGQNAEMPAMQNREIAQQHVMAILEADGLVAHARRLGALAPAQPSAPDAPVAENGNVAQSFAPDQAVVEVAVAEILVLVPFVWLGHVEPAAGSLRGSVGRNDGRPLIEVERDVALEMDGVAEVIAGGEQHRTAARRVGRFNGLVDGRRVERLAVARGAKRPHVEEARARRVPGGVGNSLPCLKGQASSGQSGTGALQEIPTWIFS